MVLFTIIFKHKNMKFIKISLLFASVLAVASCTTDNLLDNNVKYEPVDSSKIAYVKFLQNFAANSPQLPTAPNASTGPQVFIYANGAKLTGNAVGYAGVFPPTAVYSTVTSGTNVRFDVVMARVNLAVVPNIPAPIAGDTISTFSQTLEPGKYYSVFFGDTLANVRVTVREDVLAAPEYQKYKVRLANWVMNPGDTLTVYSRREKAEIIQNIAHKQISDWVQLPLPVISDTFELRKKGTTTVYATVLSGTAAAFSPGGMRMYTIMARGKTGVTSKAPGATIITNR